VLSELLSQPALIKVLVVTDTGVVLAPPVWAASDACPSKQPITIIASVIIRPVDPHPGPIAEHTMAVPVIVIKVAASFSKTPVVTTIVVGRVGTPASAGAPLRYRVVSFN